MRNGICRWVKTGDTLDIGSGKRLIFVETPMLHWPDSMMTYMTGDAVLFSNGMALALLRRAPVQ